MTFPCRHASYRAVLRRLRPSHDLRAVLSALACAAAVAACASASPVYTPAKEADAMTAPESASASENPGLTAEEVGRRFLKLLEDLESRNGLSLEHVQGVTGLALAPSGNASFFEYSQDLGEGWYYSFTYVPAAPPIKEGIGLDFEHSADGFSEMTPVCGLDFEDFHNALKAMGYRDVPIHGEIGQLESWRYYKGDIALSILPQNVVAGQAGRQCVKSIGTLN